MGLTDISDYFSCFIAGTMTLGVSLCLVFGVMSDIRNAENQRKYEERVRPVCSCVERNFDSNSNGMLDPDEAVKLARAVGYNDIFPTNQPVTRLEPGGYREKDVKLVLSSSGSYAEIHGVAAGKAWPAWSEEFRFPESRLVELSARE